MSSRPVQQPPSNNGVRMRATRRPTSVPTLTNGMHSLSLFRDNELGGPKRLNEELLLAAKNGDMVALNQALDAGVNVNVDQKSRTGSQRRIHTSVRERPAEPVPIGPPFMIDLFHKAKDGAAKVANGVKHMREDHRAKRIQQKEDEKVKQCDTNELLQVHSRINEANKTLDECYLQWYQMSENYLEGKPMEIGGVVFYQRLREEGEQELPTVNNNTVIWGKDPKKTTAAALVKFKRNVIQRIITNMFAIEDMDDGYLKESLDSLLCDIRKGFEEGECAKDVFQNTWLEALLHKKPSIWALSKMPMRPLVFSGEFGLMIYALLERLTKKKEGGVVASVKTAATKTVLKTGLKTLIGATDSDIDGLENLLAHFEVLVSTKKPVTQIKITDKDHQEEVINNLNEWIREQRKGKCPYVCRPLNWDSLQSLLSVCDRHHAGGIVSEDKGNDFLRTAMWEPFGFTRQPDTKLMAPIATYQHAISLDPNDANAHNNLGKALASQGDHDGAIASFKQAISLDPKDAMVYYNLGRALAEKGEKGDLDEAITSYKRAISLDPNAADYHYNLGIALRQKGDLDGANASFQQAISLAAITPKKTILDDYILLKKKAPKVPTLFCQLLEHHSVFYTLFKLPFAFQMSRNVMNECGTSSPNTKYVDSTAYQGKIGNCLTEYPSKLKLELFPYGKQNHAYNSTLGTLIFHIGQLVSWYESTTENKFSQLSKGLFTTVAGAAAFVTPTAMADAAAAATESLVPQKMQYAMGIMKELPDVMMKLKELHKRYDVSMDTLSANGCVGTGVEPGSESEKCTNLPPPQFTMDDFTPLIRLIVWAMDDVEPGLTNKPIKVLNDQIRGFYDRTLLAMTGFTFDWTPSAP